MSKSATYNAGYDCGYNGANEQNCHFKHFATHETMHEWSKGKRDGETAKDKEHRIDRKITEKLMLQIRK